MKITLTSKYDVGSSVTVRSYDAHKIIERKRFAAIITAVHYQKTGFAGWHYDVSPEPGAQAYGQLTNIPEWSIHKRKVTQAERDAAYELVSQHLGIDAGQLPTANRQQAAASRSEDGER